MKLYFLTGLPTETDEDTLGIAELARNCVEIGKQHTTRARRSRCRSAASCPSRSPRSSGSARTRVEELQRKINLLRDDTRRRPRRPRSSGTTRRPPSSRASSAAAIVASARSSRRCGATAAPSRSGREHFDLEPVERGHGRPTASTIDWYVHRHRTEDEVLPWDHLVGRAAQGLPLAGLAATPSPRSASTTAAGPPATTAAPAPATASSTSWPRPCRPPAAARAPARTSPPAARCPVDAARPRAGAVAERRPVR